MPVTFATSIVPPDVATRTRLDRLLERNPVGEVQNFDTLCERIKSNLEVAAGMWGRCFRSEERVDIEVLFKDTGNGRASGRSKNAKDIGESRRYPGKVLIMEGAAYQIARGERPIDTGIEMVFAPTDYLARRIWFDPEPTRSTRRIPNERVDAITLFLHELAHGLGFNGRLGQDPAIAQEYGRPHTSWVSAYDEHVSFDGNHFFFNGPFATAENGRFPVPLSDGRGANNNYHHIGNDAGHCAVGRYDLMTGYPWVEGYRYCISRLDLAILKDIGLPVV